LPRRDKPINAGHLWQIIIDNNYLNRYFYYTLNEYRRNRKSAKCDDNKHYTKDSKGIFKMQERLQDFD